MVKKNRMERDGGSAVGGDGARFALIHTDSNPVQTRSEMSSVKMNPRNWTDKDIDKVRWKGGERNDWDFIRLKVLAGWILGVGRSGVRGCPWSLMRSIFLASGLGMFSGILVYAISSTPVGLHWPLLHRPFPVSSLGLWLFALIPLRWFDES